MADTKAEMFSYVEIGIMETNMDNNEDTLEECDVDDNEEEMIRDMRLLLLRISTWTVEGRRPCRLHQPSQRRGLQKEHFEMKHQKESQATDAIVEVNTQESQLNLRKRGVC